MNNVGRFHVCTLGLLYIGFFCVGQEFVVLWMGEGYELVYGCALLLIFPSLIDCPQQVARTALLVSDIVWKQAWIYVGMAVINLALSFALIPAIGVLGATIAVCVAYLIRIAAFNVLYQISLPIYLTNYFKTAYGRWCVVGALTILFDVFLVKKIAFSGWIGLGIKAALIAVVYLTLYVVVCLSKEEKATVAKMIKK